MSKSAALALSIWAVGLGSAAALAVALHRPPTAVAALPASGGEPLDRARVLEDPPPPPPRLAAETNIVLATMIVTDKGPPRRARFRDLAQMRCGSWEGLVQGPENEEVRRCD